MKCKRSIMVSPTKRRRKMLKSWPVPEYTGGEIEYEVAEFPEPEEDPENAAGGAAEDRGDEAEPEVCTRGKPKPKKKATPKATGKSKAKPKAKAGAKAKANPKASPKAKAKAKAKASPKAKCKAAAKAKSMPRARRGVSINDDEDSRISVDDALVNYLSMDSVASLKSSIIEFAEQFHNAELCHSVKLKMKAEIAQSTACGLTHYWTRQSTGVLMKESKKELVNLSVAGAPKCASVTAKMAMTMKAGELLSIVVDGLIADNIVNPWTVVSSVEADSMITVIKEQLLQALLTLSRAD